MATENKFDKLRSMVHEGVPLEKTASEEKETNPVDPVVKSSKTEIAGQGIDTAKEVAEPTVKSPEPPARTPEKRKRKPQADYQSSFFARIDFTHRKPLYITATTHRRLMRIVHLMDESKATISSYVENIILNHLDTFKEEIDTIYRTNTINPTE